MATVVESDQRAGGPEQVVPVRVVDVDVHPAPAGGVAEIVQFLPARWRFLERTAKAPPYRLDHVNNGARVDAAPPGFQIGMAGTDPALMERQLLDDAEVDYAIFVYHTTVNAPGPEADAALCRATNEWMAATWLGEHNAHGRYRGSLRLPMQNPAAAIAELERWADHPYFVQILAVQGYSPGFGHPMYEPVLRAVAERGLPLAVHPSSWIVADGSPVGHWTYFFEHHALYYSSGYAAHVSSLVCNGVFERLPELRVVALEGGIGWAYALGNHLDKNWWLLKDEVPELTLAPSEYMRRQLYFSTQPIEEPPNPAALLQVFEAVGEDRVMFSTDYPHFDFDDPKTSLPRMPAELKARVMAGTACELYGLPRERRIDAHTA